jgi:hypothetical protein
MKHNLINNLQDFFLYPFTAVVNAISRWRKNLRLTNDIMKTQHRNIIGLSLPLTLKLNTRKESNYCKVTFLSILSVWR